MVTFVFQETIVSAGETPTYEISVEKEQYDIGDIIIATVQLSNTGFNSTQFAVYFDPNIVVPVNTSEEEASSFGHAVIRDTSNYYNGFEETGIFSFAGASLNKEDGLVGYALYVDPSQKEVDGGVYEISEEPFDILGIRFKAIANGDPKIQYDT